MLSLWNLLNLYLIKILFEVSTLECVNKVWKERNNKTIENKNLKELDSLTWRSLLRNETGAQTTSRSLQLATEKVGLMSMILMPLSFLEMMVRKHIRPPQTILLWVIPSIGIMPRTVGIKLRKCHSFKKKLTIVNNTFDRGSLCRMTHRWKCHSITWSKVFFKKMQLCMAYHFVEKPILKPF